MESRISELLSISRHQDFLCVHFFENAHAHSAIIVNIFLSCNQIIKVSCSFIHVP